MKKSTIITFRLNEMEEQQLREIAGESQLTLSQYIRKKIQEQPIVKVYQPKELLKQLSGIGNNVNQIARHANTYHTVSDGEIQQSVMTYFISIFIKFGV